METNELEVVKGRYLNGIPFLGSLYKKSEQDEYTYLLKDRLGTTTKLIDESGEEIASFTYDVFGAIRNSTIFDERGMKQKYTGKELDENSGLSYFGSRYYDANIGRFITSDSYTFSSDDKRVLWSSNYYANVLGALNPSLLNTYIYCLNDPINKIDITGHNPLKIKLLIILTLISIAGIIRAGHNVSVKIDEAALSMYIANMLKEKINKAYLEGDYDKMGALEALLQDAVANGVIQLSHVTYEGVKLICEVNFAPQGK